jgi:hypothetical protein
MRVQFWNEHVSIKVKKVAAAAAVVVVVVVVTRTM